MSLRNDCRATVFASCVGYAVQAIIINFAPLLFLTFREDYGISFSRLTLLITVNFLVQLATDILSSRLVRWLGYRKCLVAANWLAALGLVLLCTLPSVLVPFWGILIATCVYAVGGGLLEVLVSPLCEACPVKNKTALMSFLHSFFCWGVVLCVALSTLYFSLVGTKEWPLLALLWAILPLLNGILFCFVPIYEIDKAEGGGQPLRVLLSEKQFWLMLVFMVAAGASELAVSQWASAFTESALGVSKTLGDLIGVCGFAVMMGIGRLLHAKIDTRVSIEAAMIFCSVLCTAGYLLIGFSSGAFIGLIGCAVCGFGVGIFWPATYSLASQRLHGGTAMFALLAVAGDLGCTVGPTVVGTVADLFSENLRHGFLIATVFPLTLLLGYLLLAVCDKRKAKKQK